MEKINPLKLIIVPCLSLITPSVVVLTSTSCGSKSNSDTIHVKSITLDANQLSIYKGETASLVATVLPENATDKSVVWSSGNKSVVTVDDNGNIKAVSEGTATIRATTNDGGKTAMCIVNVRDVIHVENIKLDVNEISIHPYDTLTLVATILPENATDKSVVWSSDNKTVVTVDDNGNIRAVSEGTAAISATTNDGGKTAICIVHVEESGVEEPNYFLVNANSDSTLELINKNNNLNLQYSTDQENWNEYTNKIDIPKNTELYLRGYNPNGWSTDYLNYSSLKIDGDVDLSGSVMSLIDNKGLSKQIPCDYCFAFLFENSKGINEVSDDFLPATELTVDCYASMFSGCSSLTKAPDLPATKLTNNCYNSMFYGCESLTKAPDLPATKLAESCYHFMFQNCTSLTEVPDLLPATNLLSKCYSHMFYGCESLTTAPDLPATALQRECYQFMFSSCWSLTTAPDLPATTLAKMCYSGMFNMCIKLSSVKIYYEGNYDDNYFENWVYDVSGRGTCTFYYNGNQQASDFGFPNNWATESFDKNIT